jgi:hypothetical protein
MYFPVLLWSLVIFASFWGYGEALRRALKRPEFDDLGWGLTAAWGMAVTLAIGGFLMMLSLANEPLLIALVLIGFAFFAFFYLIRWSAETNKKSKKNLQNPALNATGLSLPDVLLWLLAGLAFATSIAWPHQIDPNDDLVCYLVFPERILQTGTLIEPYSFRRILTFGGQSLLQALVFIPGFERNAHIPDRGFSELIFLGLIIGIIKKHPRTALVVLVGFLAMLVPVPRINTAGAFTGGVLLLGLVLTLEKSTNSKSRDLAGFFPSALLAAAASTIRPTFLFAAALVCFLQFFFSEKHNAFDLKNRFLLGAREAFIFGFLILLLIAPWMILLFLSCGTPLCPPFAGNFNPEFQIQDYPGDFFKNLATSFSFAFSLEMIPLFLGILSAALLPRGRSVLLAGVSVLLTTLLLVFMQASLMKQEFYRYLFPVVFPVAVLALLRFATQESSERNFIRDQLARILAAASLLGIGAVQFGPALNEVFSEAQSLPQQTSETRGFLPPEFANSYKELQSKVPPEKKIYAIVDAPYLLDFKRNPIFVADVLGGASPGNLMPQLEGTQALFDYFKKEGIEYVLAVEFEKALLLYTRKHWLEHQRPEWFYKQVWGKYALDFMDRIDDIAKTHTIATAGNTRLLKLSYPD